MWTATVSSLLEAAYIEVAGAWPLGSDLQRFDTLTDEVEGLTKRAFEWTERSEFGDVFSERGAGAVIELAVARSRTVDERQRGIHNGLQRNLLIGRGLRDRRDQSRNPLGDRCRQSRFLLRRHAVVVRQFRIAGARLVTLAQQAQRQPVSDPTPARLGAGERSRRLRGPKALVVLFDPHV